MITVEALSFTYHEHSPPALVVPRLHIDEGELALVVGATGSGKSTLLGALNGLVPHFTGGTLAGRVEIAGRDTAAYRPRDLADVIGLVQQDPSASFVTDTVEDEIAYGMEVLGFVPTVMRRRVEETLDVLGLAEVRRRHLRELSGGQQQRVAIAAVLAAGPEVLVLDEPTSALDPVAAEDVLAALTRLVHDMALTVVLAEHRLERVIHHADSVILIQDGIATDSLPPAEAMARACVVPPVVALGRMAGWSPLPLSVRAARRAAGPLRKELALIPSMPEPLPAAREPKPHRWLPRPRNAEKTTARPVIADIADLDVRRGDVLAVQGLSITLHPGEITALMGRNGSGKSTLLWTLVGQLSPERGTISIGGLDPRTVDPSRRIAQVGLVPQDPMALLYAETVEQECRAADSDMGADPGSTAQLLARIAGPVEPSRHPRDLSEGQRLSLALAIVLAGAPPLVLLDEPTRGLDYSAKSRLVSVLQDLADAGHAIVTATHDVELAAEVATRVVLLADGGVVADDESAAVLARSTAYAPQVARVCHPLGYLTVAQVASDLADRERSGS